MSVAVVSRALKIMVMLISTFIGICWIMVFVAGIRTTAI